MQINIAGGENQIGGNMIEIKSDATRILLDAGTPLTGQSTAIPKGSFDALILSHYHEDHIGRVSELNRDIPIFIGKNSYNIICAKGKYLKKPVFYCSHFLENKKSFMVGDIEITPYLCDHSAYDSYMILLKNNGEKILYTGDFRSNGRKSFTGMLNDLPHIDTLICEGTRVANRSATIITETDLENELSRMIQSTEGPVFVLCAATNIDRIVSIYKAAQKAKRLLLQDLYMAEITSAAGGKIPCPQTFNIVKVFVDKPVRGERKALLDRYCNKISRAAAAKVSFVMCIRSSMGNHLQKLSKQMSFDKGLVIYSMWEGYKANPETAQFLSQCEELGLEIKSLHATGHADSATIGQLVKRVKPTKILPIHTENSDWFKQFR